MKAFLVFSSLSAICCRSCSSRLLFSISSALMRLSSGCICASCSWRLFASASRSWTVCSFTNEYHYEYFIYSADQLISSLRTSTHYLETPAHSTKAHRNSLHTSQSQKLISNPKSVFLNLFWVQDPIIYQIILMDPLIFLRVLRTPCNYATDHKVRVPPVEKHCMDKKYLLLCFLEERVMYRLWDMRMTTWCHNIYGCSQEHSQTGKTKQHIKPQWSTFCMFSSCVSSSEVLLWAWLSELFRFWISCTEAWLSSWSFAGLAAASATIYQRKTRMRQWYIHHLIVYQ